MIHLCFYGLLTRSCIRFSLLVGAYGDNTVAFKNGVEKLPIIVKLKSIYRKIKATILIRIAFTNFLSKSGLNRS